MTTQDITFTLQTLRCIREKDSDSSPYLWTAFLWIDDPTLTVGVLTPLVSDDRVVLQSNLQPGQSAPIPSSVGVFLRPFDTILATTQLILVTAIWQKHDTPSNAVDAGFEAFGNGLQSAITSNLLGLGSPDPQAQQAAVTNIKNSVNDSITAAISDSLSDVQKAEVYVGALTLDSLIDSSSQVFRTIASHPLTIILGDPLGGRLLFYRDFTQDGTGDVDTPSVIGLGGWAGFKFLFTGGNGIIYAVDDQGRLLFYRDQNQDGTGDVNTPAVIGQGGWADFKFLFSGGNGIIYAVNQQGQLLFYRDFTQDGSGDVNTPAVIGQGGWADFKFLFSGGSGIIYAVDQQGQLLFYRDSTQDGSGDVNTPSMIGLGGWADFQFLFSGGNGIIYAVDEQGELLFYRDFTQDGTGDVNTPSRIGLGGWADFQFLLSGGNGILYAVEKDLDPHHHYEIDGTLQLATEICTAEIAGVSAANMAVQDLQSQIANLQSQMNDASAAEKTILIGEIRDTQQLLKDAKASLAEAKQALADCRARSLLSSFSDDRHIRPRASEA
jgi:hypothetical protein